MLRQAAGVKTTAATTAKSPTLNLSSAPQQQAYSVGVSIGQDALKTLSSQAAKGLNLQQETVLKGINDVFAGKPALDDKARNKALFDVSQRLYKNIDKLEQQTLREGKKYQQQFAAQKGAVLKEGIYSRIDYPGCDNSGDQQAQPQAPQVSVHVVRSEPLSVTTELPIDTGTDSDECNICTCF